jgi:hypothetical protein
MPGPSASCDQVALNGPPVPPQGRIQLYPSDEWEEFIREWATAIESDYAQIKRFGGSGDKGADVAAFKTAQGLEGPWDCYQAKHYSSPLGFSAAAPEIAKTFLSVINGHYVMPDAYNFFAPKGCGTRLNQLLSSPMALRSKFIAELSAGDGWAKNIAPDDRAAIQTLAQKTDFSRFRSVEILDALEVHSRTRYHAYRFGVPLAARPPSEPPPSGLREHEVRYVEQLVEVYSERHPDQEFEAATLAQDSIYGRHFIRQRIAFYKAEALMEFARDSVPPGTFEKLQEDVHSGIIDIVEADHPSGYARLGSVLAHVGQLDLNRHRLISVSDNDDRKGICHHLANEDHLTWVTGS